MPTVPEALKAAIDHHKAGRLDQAGRLYASILKTVPGHADATHLLGVLAHQRGDHRTAIRLIQTAIVANPRAAVYHKNLGGAMLAAGNLAGAIEAQTRAVELDPKNADARHGLAEAYRTAQRNPLAIEQYNKALEIDPQRTFSLNGLALALTAIGRFEQAEAAYRQAFRIQPDFPEGLTNYANLLKTLGRRKQAEACFLKALALKPDSVPAAVNLGNLYKDAGQMAAARQWYERSLELKPGFAPAHNNLANLLKDQGDAAGAVHHFRQACASDPQLVDADSNLMLGLHYPSGIPPEAVFREHLGWARRHGDPLTLRAPPHPNPPEPERVLRIGYVSPDFRRHPVASFIEPVLRLHDRGRFHVTCYSGVEKPDAVTQRLRGLADRWRDMRGIADSQAATGIRQDEIDILVDLTGHTAFSRLRVFARKPAPVQVSWLGYPNTSGLAAMDWRITDALADPPGLADRLHSERLWRMKDGFLCFQPATDAPEVGPLPMRSAGHVTFGSFNMLAKVTPEVVAAWSAVMRQVEGSRFVMKAPPLADEGARARIARQFEANGIAAGRVEMLGYVQSHAEHMGLYNRIDLGLDTFPYNGTTTTCEALWMGVPVVTPEGEAHWSRVGVSLLRNLGLGELVAPDADAYVGLSVALARDPDRLAALRGGMRGRMAAAPLLDGAGFVAKLEAAFRAFWRDWCARRRAGMAA